MDKNRKIKQIRRKDTFLIYAIFFLGIKLILMKEISIYAITTSPADDGLMVHIAEQILRLKWLGGYNHYTLAKGCFFPFFLAVGKLLHIDYISWVQIFYAAACYLFLRAVRPTVRFQWTIYLLYIILLFHPIMASSEVIQRVYRNSITPAQVLLLFGGQIGIFIRCESDCKQWGKWAVVSAVGFVSLWFSREDTIWVVPFLIISTGLIFLKLCRKGNFFINNRKQKLKQITVLVLPVLLLLIGQAGISSVNGMVYGSWTDNELNHGEFPRVMKALYAIDMEEPAPYTSISKEKVEKVYEVSPTLASIQESLDWVMSLYAETSGRIEENKKNGNVENGWFFWAFRDAVQLEGYYETPEKANAFYHAVTEEIEAAFQDGQLKKQWTMPSALMPPWKKGMLVDLIQTIGKIADYVSSGQDIVLADRAAIDDGSDGIERFEWITGRSAVKDTAEEEKLTYRIFNYIAELHRKCGIGIAWIGRCSVVVLLILFFLKKIEKEEKEILLLLTGIGGGILCLYMGVAYNELRSCWSVVYMYLCGAYPLVQMLYLLAIVALIQSRIPENSRKVQKHRGE